ncbi:MAG TPA: hypothetical protein VHK88_11925, partial [Aquihabitans sp.]|nr:hypothetical protein [Aquihabitans sp.]
MATTADRSPNGVGPGTATAAGPTDPTDGDPAPGPSDPWLGGLAATLFATTSRLRSARTFHPRGQVLCGTASLTGRGSALADRGSCEALVRFSRGIGLPELLPDFDGVAVRLVHAHGPGAHQDLLLVSSGSAPVLRHALVPTRTWHATTFTSVLAFEVAGETSVLGARVHAVDGSPLATAADLVAAATGPGLVIELLAATATGPWRPIGTVALDRGWSGDQGALG